LRDVFDAPTVSLLAQRVGSGTVSEEREEVEF
jgi:hypothetical protein